MKKSLLILLPLLLLASAADAAVAVSAKKSLPTVNSKTAPAAGSQIDSSLPIDIGGAVINGSAGNIGTGFPGSATATVTRIEGWAICNSHRVATNGQSDPNGPWTAIDLVLTAGSLFNYSTHGYTITIAPLTFAQLQSYCASSLLYLWCQNAQIGPNLRLDGYEVVVGPNRVPMSALCYVPF